MEIEKDIDISKVGPVGSDEGPYMSKVRGPTGFYQGKPYFHPWVAPSKSLSPSPPYPLSLRGNFRSHHQSRSAPHLPTPLASEVTSEATIKVAPPVPPPPTAHTPYCIVISETPFNNR